MRPHQTGNRYLRSKGPTPVERVPARIPNFLRLRMALAEAVKMMESDWLYDVRAFSATPETRTGDLKGLQIGNLPGYIARNARSVRGALDLHPMVGGVPVMTTAMLRLSLGDPKAIAGVRSDMRWHVSTIRYVTEEIEVYGWQAVCEWFNLGMWDARRLFQAYGHPAGPRLETTIDAIDRFISNGPR